MKNINWGEAVLWLGFVLFCGISLEDQVDAASTVAGLFVLAAIGVRATRQPTVAEISDDK